MAKEIERKFLVADASWREQCEPGVLILQAYIACQDSNVARVRILGDGSAILTIKTGKTAFIREEFEYPIPISDARKMMEKSIGSIIDKTRYLCAFEGFIWEVDVYHGALVGLVIAEVEMSKIDDDPAIPLWIGREVTGQKEYSNHVLALKGLPTSML